MHRVHASSGVTHSRSTGSRTLQNIYVFSRAFLTPPRVRRFLRLLAPLIVGAVLLNVRRVSIRFTVTRNQRSIHSCDVLFVDPLNVWLLPRKDPALSRERNVRVTFKSAANSRYSPREKTNGIREGTLPP